MKQKYFLILVLLIASILRIYRLGSIPPSLSWDEAAAGYNGFTIANWGRDEWGNSFPAVFSSFLDDKHPVWIYATALSEKILGLTEFSTRLPSALFGVLNVLILYALVRLWFNEIAGLLAALFLAVSPFNLQFSRGEWEANYALFFMMFGLWLFFKYLKSKDSAFLILSFISFGVDLLTYHSSKIVTPAIVVLLIGLYYKQLIKFRKGFILALAALCLFVGLIIHDPRLSGEERANQTKIVDSDVVSTALYKVTHSYSLGYTNVVLSNYLTHFHPDFLFIYGDKNARLSIQDPGIGEFYWLDLPFILIGSIFLIRRPSKVSLIIFAWLLLAPIPASLTREVPHAHRALFLMGSLNTIAAVGASSIFERLKSAKWIFLTVLVIVLGIFVKSYLTYYYGTYYYKNAIDWQYGMKQIVEYTLDHPEYTHIYVTNVRSQPYIFFLYYLKIDVNDFQNSVIYEQDKEIRKYSLVSSFDKYYFNDFDPLKCPVEAGVLCAVTDSQYGGLNHRIQLKVKDKIYYPNSSDVAFYLVSAN